MTVATFPPCRKRIAPFPSDRKCGNKALPARARARSQGDCYGERGGAAVAHGDISMNFAAGTVLFPKVQRV